jgi:hypothetical protein
MLHSTEYIKALYGSARRYARIKLGIKKRPVVPILSLPLENIIKRHAWICSVLRDWLPTVERWKGRPVCEAGAGDCLAAASMVLGLGASRVTIVEHEPPVMGSKQESVLRELRNLGYPCDRDILDSNHLLNRAICTYIESYMEHYTGHADCSLTYSICVGEHVEDLPAFFKSCYNTLCDGGEMMHYIDLGGHGIFEDPVPPLEFHRYGSMAYGAIYPPYNRATRRFVSDYVKAANAEGFRDVKAVAVRKADHLYVRSVLPRLKAHARKVSEEELGVIEFVLYGQKPSKLSS